MSRITADRRLFEALKHIVDGLSATQRGARQQAFDRARALLDQPPTSTGRPGRPPKPLYLWTAADQPPARVTPAEAAARLGLAVQSLRLYLSAGRGAHGARVNGQVVVVARSPDGLSAGLRSRYDRTGHLEDLLELPDASSTRY